MFLMDIRNTWEPDEEYMLIELSTGRAIEVNEERHE